MKAAYRREFTEGCVGTLYVYFVVGISLVSLLDREPASHQPFVEACQHFHLVDRNFPVGSALLKGLQALALEDGVTLPRECEPFCSAVQLANGNFKDVPVSYVIPRTASSSESGTQAELGNLIEKWSSTLSL